MRLWDAVKSTIIPKWSKRQTTGSFVVQKQWVDTSKLTIDLLDELYLRNGTTHKIVNKLTDDRFDKWFKLKTDNEIFRDTAQFLDSDKKGGLKIISTMTLARNFALRHGYSVIFIAYKDAANDISEPVKNPQSIEYFRVISKRFIKEIVLDEDTMSQTFGQIIGYKLKSDLFDGQVTEIQVHASRTVHVINRNGNDPEGLSMLIPPYNWFNMFDDLGWSIGQSFFRYGSGFPVISVGGWETLPDDQKEDLQAQWQNVTSMTGWVGSSKDTIEFKGAAGRALSPQQYYDAGLSLIATSIDLPKALIEGVNAGQVTGSETNMKQYFQTVSSKQNLEEEPIVENIYGRLIETGQLPRADFEIEWLPLFEETQKEIQEKRKLAAETDKILAETGLRTKLTQEAIESGDLIEIETLNSGQPNNNIETPPSAEPIQPVPTTPETGDKKDAVIKSRREDPLTSKFNQPVFKKMEDKYFKELSGIFKVIEKSVILITKPFFNKNLKDAIGTDLKKLTRGINGIFTLNKKDFPGIIRENITAGVNSGLDSSRTELGMNVRVPQSAINDKRNIIETEHASVVNGIAEDIQKDINVNLGIASLNPPTRFAAIEKLIRDSFSKQAGRLKNGVINEFNSSLNQGNLLGYEASGIVVGKEWVSVVDGTTTDTCLGLNGEVVPIGESFSTGDFAPPANSPPHPCRSSLRSITASEAASLPFKLDSKQIEHKSNQKDFESIEKLKDRELDLLIKKKEVQINKARDKLITELKEGLDE
jgi:phage-related protein (TIGR01555 family)